MGFRGRPIAYTYGKIVKIFIYRTIPSSDNLANGHSVKFIA